MGERLEAAADGRTGYLHHHECVKCGYDLIGQPEQGVCPECGALVAETMRFSLWSVTAPRRLARSRIGLRLIAMSIFAYVMVLVAALAIDAIGVGEGADDLLGVSVTILAAVAALTGFVLVGAGAGSSGRTRWLPLTLVIAMVGWVAVDAASLLPPGAMWVEAAVGMTLFWLTGVALQLLVVHVSKGVARRAARVRSSRFMKVTWSLLLIPVVAIWAIAAVMLVGSDLESGWWVPVLLAIQGAAALIALWMLWAAVHWVRLLRFWRAWPTDPVSPRTLHR